MLAIFQNIILYYIIYVSHHGILSIVVMDITSMFADYSAGKHIPVHINNLYLTIYRVFRMDYSTDKVICK